MDEEEEVLVYMNFNSKMDESCFSPEKEIKIIGLDEDKPVLKFGNQVFQGEWRDAMGTNIFLEENKTPPKYDSTFADAPDVHMKYSSKTDKVLHMSRIFVNSKKLGTLNPESEGTSEN